ncbi:MAG: gfo/Idh/MocA family oxidoreductase, partial [Anaerolineales bacterium]
GYIVNAVIDACYKSAQTKKWEAVELSAWRGERYTPTEVKLKDYDDSHYLIKEERMPNGKLKIILKDKMTGDISQIIKEE